MINLEYKKINLKKSPPFLKSDSNKFKTNNNSKNQSTKIIEIKNKSNKNNQSPTSESMKNINIDNSLSNSRDINILQYKLKANEKYGTLFSIEDKLNDILLPSNENNPLSSLDIKDKNNNDNNIISHSKTNRNDINSIKRKNVRNSPKINHPKSIKYKELMNNVGTIKKIIPLNNITNHKRQKTALIGKINANINLSQNNEDNNKEMIKNRNNKTIDINDKSDNNLNKSKNNNISININLNKSEEIVNKKEKIIKNQLTTKDSIKEKIRSNNRKNIEMLVNKYKLTKKEKVFLILAKSPVLRLRYQLIFAHSTSSIRKAISTNDILENYDNMFKIKIEELQNKISFCNKTLDVPFKASKTAEITFNFISTLDEAEFMYLTKLFTKKDNGYSESEIHYYYNFILLLYWLFNKKSDINVKKLEREKMKLLMYNEIHKRGYSGIKDCLYQCFISNGNNINKSIAVVCENYNRIDKLIKSSPEILKYHKSVKLCKFTCYSFYLIKEILSFVDKLEDARKLKIKVRNLLNLVNRKYSIYQTSYKDKINNDN